MSKIAWSARTLAVEILTLWKQNTQPIDHIRDRLLTGSDLEERDRNLVTEIVYGVVRNSDAIDAQLARHVHAKLEKMQDRLLSILRVGAYQLVYLDRVPAHAVINDAVEMTKKAFSQSQAGLVNAVLRKISKMNEPAKRPIDAFYAKGSPLYRWRAKWLDDWGEEKTDALIQFFANMPRIGLRRNLLKTESDSAWLEILKAEGVKIQTLENWAGYVYSSGIQPDSLPSFNNGITTVQDPAAGIAPRVLDPQPGENILDLCSAPGGKSAVIWELMGGEGTLLAIDRSMKRNSLTRDGLKRLGHTAISVETADIMEWNGGLFDRVLIDVPCSGTGVAHRRPDLLVRRSPKDVPQLAKIQRSLINHASEYVKPGGILVYSTCSLEKEENERICAGFDKRNGSQFKHDPIPDTIPDAWRKDESTVAVFPSEHHIDGAFVKRWKRIA
ncbi:16S rRNA (cytosine(967)-C(5))-methyltransferase RsmB [bacterium]|nr:16S rRNA (cytosine(967)-C(5))-methyltransferase RsmB [bacterium]